MKQQPLEESIKRKISLFCDVPMEAVVTAADLPGVDSRKLGLEGSPTRVSRIESPPRRASKGEMIPVDNVDEAVSALVDKLRAAKAL